MPIDTPPDLIIPADAVPVTPATPNRLNSKKWASVVETVGMVLFSLQLAIPEINKLFPHAEWVGVAIAALGKVWTSIQKQLDEKTTQVTNYTAPQVSVQVPVVEVVDSTHPAIQKKL